MKLCSFGVQTNLKSSHLWKNEHQLVAVQILVGFMKYDEFCLFDQGEEKANDKKKL
jgi:hypothetical protein